ncbi:hypothetical protein [Kribbella sp. NBC_00889]|nr:hypothetical protein OG817_21870 [Kribbella sp. NBC_00889]
MRGLAVALGALAAVALVLGYWWGPRLLIGGIGAIGLGALLGSGVRSRVH